MCDDERKAGRSRSTWFCRRPRSPQSGGSLRMDILQQRLREVVSQPAPLPGLGHTAARHRLFAETAREDISLAKLAEAHWDALAILAEAGKVPKEGALYAVWASEIPGMPLRLPEA